MVKREAETPAAALTSPDALEPTSTAQERKRARAAPLSPLKGPAFPQEIDPSLIARIAATGCGYDEGTMAAVLMGRPIMAATRVFDFIQMPDYLHAEENLCVLLDNFGVPFEALGGSAVAVLDEWSRLHRMVMRDEALSALPLAELYSRALLHFQHNHFNLLFLMAIIQANAIDVVLGECGAQRLLPSLKRESAQYKGKMLLFLVGHAWQTVRVADASMIRPTSLIQKWIEVSA
jgi:hypothetical protein